MADKTYKGSCSCGAIQIEVQGGPAHVALCHCRNCHKTTSSTYSLNWVVPRTNFKVVAGEPTTYIATGGSGNPVERKFCNKCSSTLWTESASFAGVVVVKAGVMDDNAFAEFQPASETFTSRKPGWVPVVEGAAQFEEAWKAPAAKE
ncbi:hypothetical protein SPBR_03299 [Sporothrix brasiliensis 5110]|uniref:CENP-V/GFA domain-containing protein n=1 Tax=Sporothrix brasiliensis 5110 TaxID=1398154 RepID=A0A0C2F2W6_9PEZI|nr:uncharacterized protein SPBR_03299 [Sporothrix brasiliensis 5110]KIH93224.1 hypothetical protein SPBR_03299 [Sporothrix brasiliensis 5110]